MQILSSKTKKPSLNHKESKTALYSLERMTGIEPATSAWEADVLPLNYIRITDPPLSERVIFIHLIPIVYLMGQADILCMENRILSGLALFIIILQRPNRIFTQDENNRHIDQSHTAHEYI